MPGPRIQLLTFAGCPLAAAARTELESALTDLGIDGYEEIDLNALDTPDQLRGWGSPTILIDGIEATGQPKGDQLSCRVYATPEKVPNHAAIVAAIRQRNRGRI